MCSNDEFQHQAFWDKVVTKLNEEQTWISQQEVFFLQQNQEAIDIELLFCQTYKAELHDTKNI